MRTQQKYVAPEISKEKAQKILSRKTSFLSLRIRNWSIKPMRIELIYLPYYVFEILLTGKGGEQKVTISVDGVLGNTMFFAGQGLNYVLEQDTKTCGFTVSLDEARKIATKEYTWLLLEQGLRSKKMTTIKEITGVKTIFYPFWIGYFQKGQSYDFKALDAVSGEVQGVKMRKVFLKAFRQMS